MGCQCDDWRSETIETATSWQSPTVPSSKYFAKVRLYSNAVVKPISYRVLIVEILKTGEVIWKREDTFNPDASDAGLVTSMHFVSHPAWSLLVTHVEAGITYVDPFHDRNRPLTTMDGRYWDARRHSERHEHRPMPVFYNLSLFLVTNTARFL